MFWFKASGLSCEARLLKRVLQIYKKVLIAAISALLKLCQTTAFACKKVKIIWLNGVIKAQKTPF
jgi:hypothetical protein